MMIYNLKRLVMFKMKVGTIPEILLKVIYQPYQYGILTASLTGVERLHVYRDTIVSLLPEIWTYGLKFPCDRELTR